MQAIARKIELAVDVDLGYYAEATEGFSGADLQALIYNAHLEVVHSSLEIPSREKENSETTEDITLKYTSFGGAAEEKILSGAEQDSMNRRVCSLRTFL